MQFAKNALIIMTMCSIIMTTHNLVVVSSCPILKAASAKLGKVKNNIAQLVTTAV